MLGFVISSVKNVRLRSFVGLKCDASSFIGLKYEIRHFIGLKCEVGHFIGLKREAWLCHWSKMRGFVNSLV